MFDHVADQLDWEHQVFDGAIRGAFEDDSRKSAIQERINKEMEAEQETRPKERESPMLRAIEGLSRADQFMEETGDSGIDHRDELDICGIIIYPFGMDRPLYMDHHVAFLFDNSEHLLEEDRGVLVDLHFGQVEDLEKNSGRI